MLYREEVERNHIKNMKKFYATKKEGKCQKKNYIYKISSPLI